jgi:hypothetical protein
MEKNKKLGTLLISRGNIEWLPKSKSVNRRQLFWSEFDYIMRTQGRSTKKKKIKK